MNDVILQNSCPLCGSKNLRQVKKEINSLASHKSPLVNAFDRTWVHLMQCQECSFAFCQEIPSHPDFFNQRYSVDYDPMLESQSDFKNVILEDIFRLLGKYGKPNGKLLDVGSFAGVFLQAAKVHGFEVEGVELNSKMARFSQEKLGLKVFNGKIHDFSAETKFDVITLIDVLEHLYRPQEIIEKCTGLLKPGGLLVIKVPNYMPQRFKQAIANKLGTNSLGIFDNFSHINQFSPRALDKACMLLGLSIEECAVARSEMWPGSTIKNKFRNMMRNIFYELSRFITVVTGKNVGLNIIHISRKPL